MLTIGDLQQTEGRKPPRVTICNTLATSISTTSRPARRRYKKPPLAQAICEFQFRAANEWDWTIPGLVYQEIKSEFPQKRQEKAFQINIAPKEGRIEQNLGGGLSKMQFVRADGSAMVQVGPDLLSINVSRPYPGWEGFDGLIRRQFEIYTKIARPSGFKRIGLRFVNQIIFPTDRIEITEFFHYYPKLPESVEQLHGPFAMRVVHLYEGERDLLNLQMGNIGPKEDTMVMSLDLDYYLAQPDKVELERGSEWVSLAHDRIEAMFEACITNKTRELFEEIK